MDFQFTPEHDELRQSVRKFLTDKASEQAVRRVMSTQAGYDADVWAQMAEQMGLPGLAIAEEHGGAGLGFIELAIVMEEMGRTLLPAPFLSSAVLAASALQLAATPEAQAELLPQIASGKTLVSLAYAEPERGWEIGAAKMSARKSGAAYSVDGTKRFVLDGHIAHVLLVVARTKEGLGLFRVEADAAGVQRALLPTLDLTRKLADITFKKVRAQNISRAGDQTAALEKALQLAVVALACEQAGGAQRCLEMSTEYAKTRLQFGRAIGSFQAIKHRCADMLVAVEFSKSAAYHAAFRAAENDDAELAAAASMAKSYCSDAYFQVANETIQVHGGMGFTWEHPAHLFFKRAKSSAVLFGDPSHYRQKLATSIGI